MRPTLVARRSLTPELRLVQIYYVLVLIVGLSYAALVNPKGDIGHLYDLSMLRAVIQMCTSAQALYLIQRRSSVTIPFCIVSTSICLILAIVDTLFFGAYAPIFDMFGGFASVVFFLLEYALAIVVIVYLLRSRRAKNVLSLPLDNRPEGRGHSYDRPLKERVQTWAFWRDLVIYFIVFSFLGHWAEILFCRLIVAGVFMGGYDPTNAMLWDQWLFPFSAEGTALAMVVLVLHPLKQYLLKRFNGRVLPALGLSFLINAAVCTSIDFMTGMVANQNYELWDYRDMPFNFLGQVCLQNSMVYSIAATLIVWVCYPLMDRLLRIIPRSVADALFFGLVGIYLFEAALHFVVI